MPGYWLIKSDEAYTFDHLLADRQTDWTGIRNFEARNNLAAMKQGDLCLFYASGKDKQVVGVAKVASKEAYPDPTSKEPGWVSVRLAPVKRLAEPVTLGQIKATAALKEMQLVKRSRLSVMPVTAAEFKQVLALGKTKLS